METRWISWLVVIVAYIMEVSVERWEARQTAVVDDQYQEVFKFITQADHVEKWFHWVTRFREMDSRPLGENKLYQAIVTFPFYGDYAIPVRITKFIKDRVIVYESDFLTKPKLEIQLFPGQNRARPTNVTMKMQHRKPSALFQFTAAPFLMFLSYEQLQYSLFLLKMMLPN